MTRTKSKFIDDGLLLVTDEQIERARVAEQDRILDHTDLASSSALLPLEFHVSHNQKTHGNRYRSGGDGERIPVKGPAFDELHSRAQGGDAEDVRQRGVQEVQSRKEEIDKSPEEVAALSARQAYIGAGHHYINGALRGTLSELETSSQTMGLKHAGRLDKAFELHGVKNTDPITVHRGLNGKAYDKYAGLSPGSSIIDDGFMSTSSSKRVAESFGSYPGLTLEIRVPSGRTSLAGHPTEQELIYPRGTSLKMIGRSDDASTIIMEMV